MYLLIQPGIVYMFNYEKKVKTNNNKTNNHLSSELTRTTRYDVRKPDPGLGQAQTCGGVKPVNAISPPGITAIHI